jgi:putative redox-active protein with C_GCAxxG_C_C motif
MGNARHGVSFGTGTAFFALMRNACSGALFEVVDRAYDHPSADEERAAMPLAGGIMQHGYQCGMTWGAALAAGAQAHRLLGPGPRAEAAAIVAAARLVEAFRAQNGHVDCVDITEIDRSSSALEMFTYFAIKGGSVGCARRAARFMPAAIDAIDAALSEEETELLAGPVSCSAVLARRMGASDARATIAAGLAGGIGLCGGACGALGTAVWLQALGSLEAGAAKVDYKSPAAEGLIERFLKCTGYEFECAAIVGRRFEGVADHARHVCSGGCAKLIDALVELPPPPAERAGEGGQER